MAEGVAMMSEENRRRYGRVKLRLGIVRAKGAESCVVPVEAQGQWWTRDISVGGMYFVAPSDSVPEPGALLAFEVTVPPGEGYATHGCRFLASGQVLRHVEQDDGTTGLAVKFADTPSIEAL